jgi:hypothetical protein
MLYMHCGWPRTGSSSFQAVLTGHRDQLAEVGVDYPDRWRLRNSDAHYGITETLESVAVEDIGAVEGFLDYLRSAAARKVLISNESISHWLVAGKRESLIELLLAAQEVTTVTCLWALRRADRWAGSMYLHRIDTGHPVPAPDTYFRECAAMVPDIIAGQREVEQALNGNQIYCRYEDSGAHYGELLRAVGVADSVRVDIETDLRVGPRRNRGPSQKATAALLHADALSARAGVDLTVERLRGVFRSGDFEFDDDMPCELVDVEVAQAVHRRALEAAGEAGFKPYVEFFGAEAVEPSTPVALEPEALTDEDLSRLVSQASR